MPFFCCSQKPALTPEEQAAKKAKKELEQRRKAFEKRKNSLDSLKDGGLVTDEVYKTEKAKIATEEEEFEAEVDAMNNGAASEKPVAAQAVASPNNGIKN